MKLKEQTSRKRIFFLWLLTQVVLTTVVALLSVLLEQRGIANDPSAVSSSFDAVGTMTALFTVGLLSSVIWPTTWLSLICLGVALWRRSYLPLYIAALCAVIYGFFWPFWLATMMSA